MRAGPGKCRGTRGICGGQQLDLEWEGKILSAPELEEIYLRKTSALIRAACLMGVAAAGGTKEQEEAAAGYADNFGFAFQLRDDMLDVIGDEKNVRQAHRLGQGRGER